MRSAPWSALGKSSLPCSLSPPSLCLGSQSSCVLFFLVHLIRSVDASKVFLSGPHSGRHFSLSWACCFGSLAGPYRCRVIVFGYPLFLWYRPIYYWCSLGQRWPWPSCGRSRLSALRMSLPHHQDGSCT